MTHSEFTLELERLEKLDRAISLDKDGNAILDEKAQAYANKVFPCEPPCDSYGVCGNCYDKICFDIGYKFALEAENARLQPILKLYREMLNEAVGALAFYGDNTNGRRPEVAQCVEIGTYEVLDRGERAREAIKRIAEKAKEMK